MFTCLKYYNDVFFCVYEWLAEYCVCKQELATIEYRGVVQIITVAECIRTEHYMMSKS